MRKKNESVIIVQEEKNGNHGWASGEQVGGRNRPVDRDWNGKQVVI